MRIWIALAAAAATVVVALGGYAAWTLRALPDPGHEAAIVKAVTVYDRDGRVLAARSASGEFHVYQRLDQMGRYGPAATLAAEDRDFYRHGPLDPTSLARAGFTDLVRGGAVEGGSTITQQLVKLQLLKPQKTVSRKLQEAFLAWAVERRYTKSQILEMYLNRVYYGHGAYGLASATKTYFGRDKEPKDLSPAQAALLAALLQAPNGLDPKTNYEGAHQRALYVLKGMAATGALTPPEAERAAQEDLRPQLKFDRSYRQERAPHFVDWVIQKAEHDIGPSELHRGGMAIYTTLDGPLQALAEQAVAAGVRDLGSKGVNNGSLLAVRPATGEILAWVGSADYSGADIGGAFNVVLARRQPGSSFKPYVYSAALKDHRITLCTPLADAPTNFHGYQPLNFDNRYMGTMTARQALLLSRNIPAVAVAERESIGKVNSLAGQMGIQSPLEASLPTAIGSSEVTMFEHVQAYQVLAAQGQKMPLMGITRIVDHSASTVFDERPGRQGGGRRVLSPAEAYLIADVLKDYPRQWGLSWNRPMAAKSGTSGGSAAGVHPDAWMMAYSPDIALAAWAGNTGSGGQGKPTAAFGVNVGSTISSRFINGLPQAYNHWYPRPDGIVQGSRGEIFLAGTENDPCAGGRARGRPAATPAPAPTPSGENEDD